MSGVQWSPAFQRYVEVVRACHRAPFGSPNVAAMRCEFCAMALRGDLNAEDEAAFYSFWAFHDALWPDRAFMGAPKGESP